MSPIPLSIAAVIFALLPACAVQSDPEHVPSCADHSAAEYIDGIACEAGPDCGFDSNNQPAAITPGSPVAYVCHCIGGVYACFGRQP